MFIVTKMDYFFLELKVILENSNSLHSVEENSFSPTSVKYVRQ